MGSCQASFATKKVGMEVKEVLSMKTGDGESSYAQASKFTQKVASMTKPIVEHAVRSLLISNEFHQHQLLSIADLGCAVNPNALSVISTVKEVVERKYREMKCQILPELWAYLNDLPGNDFNSLFRNLHSLCIRSQGMPCYVMGVPGSFHGRLFPRNTLHFVHSCYSVHWLSQVPRGLASKEGLPLNKGKIYISNTSPPAVRQAYLSQFQEDFSSLLKSRSEEIVRDGRMVLIFHGRQSSDPWTRKCFFAWETLAQTLAQMVSQGLVDEEKLDSFNVPYYTASAEEVKDIVEKEGSFAIEGLESFALEVADQEEKDVWGRAEKLSDNIRSWTESIVSYQFGEEILDELYNKLTHMIAEALPKESPKSTSIVLVLRRSMV